MIFDFEELIDLLRFFNFKILEFLFDLHLIFDTRI